MDAALATALRTEAAPADRSAALLATAAALRSIAESRHRQEPPVPLASDMDLAAAVDALCSVFGELEQHRAAAEYDCVASAAVTVVGVLPTFAAVTDHITQEYDSAACFQPPESIGYAGRSARDSEHAVLLDAVMALIMHVTRFACFALVTERLRDDTAVDPLRCLIQGWPSAFRGKADCLAVADPLLVVLFGHDRCRETLPEAAASDDGPALAIPSSGAHAYAAVALVGSALYQQTVDVFSCALLALQASAGTDFEAWVIKTPYWVTLLNVAARYVCDFEPADLVNGTMPACHDAGVLMCRCFHFDKLSFMTLKVAVELKAAFAVWPVSEATHTRECGRCADTFPDLFVPSAARAGCAPISDWPVVSPSRREGALLFVEALVSPADTSSISPYWVVGGAPTFAEWAVFFWQLHGTSSLSATMASLRAAAAFCEKAMGPSVPLPPGLVNSASELVRRHRNGDESPRLVDLTLSAFAAYCQRFRDFVSGPADKALLAELLLMARTPDKFAASTMSACWAAIKAFLTHRGVVDEATAGELFAAALAQLTTQAHRDDDAELELKPPPLVPPVGNHRGWAPVAMASPGSRPNLTEHVVAAAALLNRDYTPAADAVRAHVDWIASELRRCYDAGSRINLRHPTALVRDLNPEESHSAATFVQLVEACSDDLLERKASSHMVSVFDVLLDLATQSNPGHHPFDRTVALAMAKFLRALPVSVVGAERLRAAWDFAASATLGGDHGRPALHEVNSLGDPLPMPGNCDSASNFVLLLSAVFDVHARAGLTLVVSVDRALRLLLELPKVGFVRNTKGQHVLWLQVASVSRPGDAPLETVVKAWEAGVIDVDTERWCDVHGRLLQAVSHEELPAASRRFRSMFLSETLPLKHQVWKEGSDSCNVAPVVSMTHLCRYGDHAVVRSALPGVFELFAVVFYNEAQFDTYVFVELFQLAIAALDSAVAYGVEVPWSAIDNVLWAARRALGLPRYAHPTLLRNDEPVDEDDEEDNDSGFELRVALAIDNGEETLMYRLAFAATLAVAEWMHHSCHVVFPCETVHRQGMSVERTVSGSLVAREAHDHGAHPYSAAAMTVTSVAHWLMDIEPHYVLSYPGDVVYEATSALWDRVIRWAIDPSLNAALLSHLPFEREALLQRIALSTYLSPWAEAAVQEALYPFEHTPPPRKRCR